MRYIINQADEIVRTKAGPNRNRDLGWYDSFNQGQGQVAKGLRLNVIGFACRNNQRTPKVFPYSDDMGGIVTSRAKLVQLLDELRQSIIPDGGTCPGLAIEYTIRKIEEQSFARFPLQSVILATDGRFYDMPYPERATTGLDAYSVLKFAVGIAIADNNNDFGLTKKERIIQANQLSSFVEPNPTLFKNVGVDGWALLDEVAKEITDDLATFASSPSGLRRYTWCGWRRRSNCKRSGFREGNCKWPRKRVRQYGCRQSPKGMQQ